MNSQVPQTAGGRLRGLILDLRDNPGGLLDQAVVVSDLFLNDGVIVTTVGSGNKVREERLASSSGAWSDLPVVVLTNSGSASASEIVAGALRNRSRALILGQQTFGKGSVQVIYDIEDAALKLTVAQYLTPGDESIQSVGITPHIELAPITVGDVIDLNTGEEGGEARLKNHLVNDTRTKHREPEIRLTYLYDDKDDNTDFAERLANQMLVEAGQSNSKSFIKRATPILTITQKEETQKIITALGILDVDWNSGARPKRAKLVSQLSIDNRQGLKAGDKAKLTLSVRNEGRDTVYQVRGKTSSPVDALDSQDIVIGRIPPGETRKRSLTLDLPKALLTQSSPISATLYFNKDNRPIKGANRSSTELKIAGLERPLMSYSAQIIDTTSANGTVGNGDGLIEKGEKVTLRLWLRNEGPGKSHRSLVKIRGLKGETTYLTKGRQWIDELAPGESTVVDFTIEVRGSVSRKGAEIELKVNDSILGKILQHRIVLPSTQQQGQAINDKIERLVLAEQSTLYAGASEKSGHLATIENGQHVMATGEYRGWLRVPVEPSGYGWLKNSAVKPAASDTKIPMRYAFPRSPQITEPSITMTDTPKLVTKTKRVRLKGIAHFPSLPIGEEPDLYIYRGNKKVYFENSETNTLTFDAGIDLDEGQNTITIFARSDRWLVNHLRLQIYRR